jgi:hypothetical protein
MLRGQVADDMHEDLAVMARIFGKAASKSGKNQREFAFRFAEERDLEAMYLGGAGALFFVSVDWPVAGPVKAASKPDSPKKDADSLWEQEKRRLQGDAEEDGEEDHDAPGREPDTRTYDPVRVGLLKDRLSAAYRHAANIRGVQPQEDIVVVVLGRRDAYSERGRKGRAGGMGIMSGDGAYGSFGGELPVFLANERAGGSTLVLRAKKSDVDRLASGKAGDAEFTKIVKVDSDYPVLQDSGKPPTGRHP